MKIWKLGVLDNYQVVKLDHTLNEKMFFYDNFKGEVLEQWGEYRINSNGEKANIGDAFYLLTNAALISKRALEVLKPILEINAQVLPISHMELKETLYLINVTNLINAMDFSNSKIKRFSDGRILSIDSYSFHKDVV